MRRIPNSFVSDVIANVYVDVIDANVDADVDVDIDVDVDDVDEAEAGVKVGDIELIVSGESEKNSEHNHCNFSLVSNS